MAAILVRTAAVVLFHLAMARLRAREWDPDSLGEQIAWTFEQLGGGYLKIGQILSTRKDILSESLVQPLQRLQDSLAPFGAGEARAILESAFGRPVDAVFHSFDPLPIGSASVAQVHRAILRDSGAEVAVKIRRPGIDRMVRVDAAVFMTLIRAVSRLPRLRGIPLIESAGQVIHAVEQQTSFRVEAERHKQFAAFFRNDGQVRVPCLIEEYCTDNVIVMEYFPNLVRITSAELDGEIHRSAVRTGLRGLYKMLFIAGLVHCDLHPGNILVDRQGRVVFLDFGFSTTLRSFERAAFAEMFLAIARAQGDAAAKVILETALSVPADLDRRRFETDMSDLVNRSSGVKAADFLVASFVNSLFGIQRKHRIYGSPGFTMAILSLLVYEGIIRHRCADLDFQQEAVPVLLMSLGASA